MTSRMSSMAASTLGASSSWYHATMRCTAGPMASMPSMMRSNRRVATGISWTKTLFLSSFHLSEKLAVASVCSPTRPAPSPKRPLKSSRSKLPERIAEVMR